MTQNNIPFPPLKLPAAHPDHPLILVLWHSAPMVLFSMFFSAFDLILISFNQFVTCTLLTDLVTRLYAPSRVFWIKVVIISTFTYCLDSGSSSEEQIFNCFRKSNSSSLSWSKLRTLIVLSRSNTSRSLLRVNCVILFLLFTSPIAFGEGLFGSIVPMFSSLASCVYTSVSPSSSSSPPPLLLWFSPSSF